MGKKRDFEEGNTEGGADKEGRDLLQPIKSHQCTLADCLDEIVVFIQQTNEYLFVLERMVCETPCSHPSRS